MGPANVDAGMPEPPMSKWRLGSSGFGFGHGFVKVLAFVHQVGEEERTGL